MSEKSFGDESVNSEAKQLAAQVESGILSADDTSFAGRQALAVADNNAEQIEQKKKDSTRLVQILSEVENFRRILNEKMDALREQIKDLIKQRNDALEASQNAFDQAHEAEDLLDAIQDGISEEERERIITLTGKDPLSMSKEELEILLIDINKNKMKEGRDSANEAKGLERRIGKLGDELDLYEKAKALNNNGNELEALSLIEKHIASNDLNEDIRAIGISTNPTLEFKPM